MGNYWRSPDLVFLENEVNKKINVLNEQDIVQQEEINLLKNDIKENIASAVSAINNNIAEINKDITEINNNINPVINNTNQINKVWRTDENGVPSWKNAAKVEGEKLIL